MTACKERQSLRELRFRGELLARLLKALAIALPFVISPGSTQAQSPAAPSTVMPAGAVQPTPSPAEVIPPFPGRYFTDYAGATTPKFAEATNLRLQSFERETTNQFLVVIFPKRQSTAELGDYCTRVARAWGVGQKGVNNGVVLFVFVEDRKVRLSVGRGLEATLSDQASQKIIDAMLPFFRKGDFEGGLSSAVDGVINILRVPAQPAQSSLGVAATPK